MNRISTFLSASSLLLLTACGGSGGSKNTTTIDFDNILGAKYTKGVYSASSTYKDYCETPRGSGFSDKKGSTMHEKMWLRSFTNETYLWYNEVPDLDPTLYGVIEYFHLLKTDDTTASGKNKDQFHFTYDSEEWQRLSESGVSLGYGIEWAFGSMSSPRQATVAFTETNSPAASAGIPRGAELITVDGVDFINTTDAGDIDKLNAALFPDQGSGSHTFVFKLFGSDETITATMTPADVETDFVAQSKVISTDSGNVGYMQFNGFQRPAEKPLIDGFNLFKNENVTDLVLDLRYNGGGLLYMASQLAYMIAGDENTQNTDFYRFQYNDKTASQVVPYWKTVIDWAKNLKEGDPLPTLNLSRVFILTTDGTCSASEAVMNGLLGSGVEVIQIGSTTCGKPYGFAPEDNCGTTYFTVQFKGTNDQGFGDYADGFSAVNTLNPDADPNALIAGCAVADDFSQMLGSTNEAQLAAALGYRINSQCPSPASSFVRAAKPAALSSLNIEDKRAATQLKTNLIVTH